VIEGILKGKQRKPPRVAVYGGEGIGKSTFAAGAPKPIFIQTEDGLGEVECDKFPLVTDYDTLLQQLRTVYSAEHDYETLVIDSLDWLEKLIWSDVCRAEKKKSIEEIGYGKGYKFALTQWKEVLTALDYIRNERGMAIILIAHAKIERFEDPESQGYDRYTLRLHKDADATVREWTDAVLFATRKMRVQTEDLGFNKTRSTAKAVGADGGDRIIRANGSPACVAKNRFNITGEIPLSWADFAKFL